MSIRNFLTEEHGKGVEVGEPHSYFDTGYGLPNPWTAVRHPAEWLYSMYTYTTLHEYDWEDLPKAIRELVYPGIRNDWETYMTYIQPGVVGSVFSLYCVPGVVVYRLEEINKVFGKRVLNLHRTPGKKPLDKEHRKYIESKEEDALKIYGYK
jgi:hypothetical protein